MKRTLLTLAAVAALVCSASLVSCGDSKSKSGDQQTETVNENSAVALINDLKSKTAEYVKAVENGETEKATSLKDDVAKIVEKLDELKKDGKLSDDQIDEVGQALYDFSKAVAEAATSAAGFGDLDDMFGF